MLAYRINYTNIWQDMYLLKFYKVSCTKNKVSITHSMFFQSIMSEILYLVSRLHDRKKVEVIRHFSFRA